MTQTYVTDVSKPTVPPLDPPERLLMGPGPSNPDPRVLAAMSKRLVGHLDPYFVELMDQTMGALRDVFRTENHHTLPISATGSGGLETIMMNLLEPGDDAVVCITGYFGQRLAEMARRAGADVRVVEVAPGEIVDPAEVDRLLEEKPAKLVAFVHVGDDHRRVSADRADGGGGAEARRARGDGLRHEPRRNADRHRRARRRRRRQLQQKCLGAPPGLGPITISPRAMETVKARKTKPHTWYFDLSAALSVLGRDRGDEEARVSSHGADLVRSTDSTKRCALILEEGLEARWARHQQAHETLVRGLDALGLELVHARQRIGRRRST